MQIPTSHLSIHPVIQGYSCLLPKECWYAGYLESSVEPHPSTEVDVVVVIDEVAGITGLNKGDVLHLVRHLLLAQNPAKMCQSQV